MCDKLDAMFGTWLEVHSVVVDSLKETMQSYGLGGIEQQYKSSQQVSLPSHASHAYYFGWGKSRKSLGQVSRKSLIFALPTQKTSW